MLMRTDPFREMDRLAAQLFGGAGTRPIAMPMDAYRHRGEDGRGGDLVVEFDLPGADADTIDVTVERDVLTVRAERRSPGEDVEALVAERPRGTFTRQLFLGQDLDTERLTATYDAGVLTVRIPVAEQAKARKVEVTTGSRDDAQHQIAAA
jgi:HSP20 family protein